MEKTRTSKTRPVKNNSDDFRLPSGKEMSPLGKELLKIRRQIESEPGFRGLSRDEINREVASRRGADVDDGK
jgi:hypothetical protein